jgi:hypothetical protein
VCAYRELACDHFLDNHFLREYLQLRYPRATKKGNIGIRFDGEDLNLFCVNKPGAAETNIIDMFLESLGRFQVEILSFEHSISIFSLKALRQFFMKWSKHLMTLRLWNLEISGDACGILGGIPHCLDIILFYQCSFDLQQFAKALGVNGCHPTEIILSGCDPPLERNEQVTLSSSMIPLLNNPTTRKIVFGYPLLGPKSNDFLPIKAAFESNQGLEELVLDNIYLHKNQLDALKLIFECIAAAPKLRTLRIILDGVTASHQRTLTETLTTALCDSHNKSLESLSIVAMQYIYICLIYQSILYVKR